MSQFEMRNLPDDWDHDDCLRRRRNGIHSRNQALKSNSPRRIEAVRLFHETVDITEWSVPFESF